MSVDSWLKRHGAQGGWSQRQPLEPFPSFRHRPVATAWEQVERLALHQLRRGVDVSSPARWFRAIDDGWTEPDGMICILRPRRDAHPEEESWLLVHAADPEAHTRELEEQHPFRLEIYQQWPGSRSLELSLHRACSHLHRRGPWYRWVDGDVAELSVAMDVVSNAWAHHRYWFGLESL